MQDTQLGVTIEDTEDAVGENIFEIDSMPSNPRFEQSCVNTVERQDFSSFPMPVGSEDFIRGNEKDFKGFENYVKFVEFDEKNLFDKQQVGEIGYRAKDMQLKSAQSQIFKDDDLQEISTKHESNSASNSPRHSNA